MGQHGGDRRPGVVGVRLMFELTVDGGRVPWSAYVEVFAERFTTALMAPFFTVPYLTKNGDR